MKASENVKPDVQIHLAQLKERIKNRANKYNIGPSPEMCLSPLHTEDDDWFVISRAQRQAGHYNSTSYSYRDLKGFMEEVSENAENDTIVLAAQHVITAFDQCIIANYSSTVCSSREIPGGTTASDYVMFSSFVKPSNPDPVANLQDDLGSYYNTQWRLFRWNPISTSYEEHPFTTEGLGDVKPGKGYWLISRHSATIDITGQLVNDENNGLSIYFPDCNVRAVDSDYNDTNIILFAETQWGEFLSEYMVKGSPGTDYSIPLSPGWNQIGNLFNFEVDWDLSLQVTDGEGITYPLVYTENTLTYQTIRKYENGGYGVPALMSPGEGYWIKNITIPPRKVYLIVNPARSTLSKEYIDSLEATLTAFARATEESPPAPPGGIDPEPDEENGSGGKSGCTLPRRNWS